ncbi:MAG: PorV/PorQ family protein [Chloroherpetonaceae bacterium]|nr:PorV/PorQ family protein [Chloroherpetonaceae bacterium]
MKQGISKWLIILTAVGLPFCAAQAQLKFGTTAAPFLGIGMGARATALGGAFVALADDISALYWNPAGIVRSDKIRVGFTHTQWLIGTQINWAGATVPAGIAGSFGVAITALNYGNFEVTTISNPDGTGETFSASDFAAQLSWGKSLTDRFSVGITLKFINQSIFRTAANAFALNIGFYYDTGLLPNGLKLGASISNFGTQMRLDGEGLTVNYDQTGGTQRGVNSNVPARLLTDQFNLPLIYRIGVSYDVLRDETNRFSFALDTAIPLNNGQTLNLGGEYAWKDIFFVRIGYNALFERESEKGLTFGAGLRYPISTVVLRFDYTYQTFGRLNPPQWFALSLEF